jgi:hypothetical protein
MGHDTVVGSVQRNPAIEATNDFSDATASALAAIGIRIKEIRLARGMTLQTVSDESGLSPSMLSLVSAGAPRLRSARWS